jgi:hypothetical protein
LDRDAPILWIYIALVVIGAGLGLTMLTLLIAVQQAVPRTVLGTATSLNQFSRSIGGAIGVAIMGAVLSAGLANRMHGQFQLENPNALMEPSLRATLSPATLEALRQALYESLQNVFSLSIYVSALSLILVLRLPRNIGIEREKRPPKEACTAESGERLVMAELATIDADHEPVAGK